MRFIVPQPPTDGSMLFSGHVIRNSQPAELVERLLSVSIQIEFGKYTPSNRQYGEADWSISYLEEKNGGNLKTKASITARSVEGQEWDLPDRVESVAFIEQFAPRYQNTLPEYLVCGFREDRKKGKVVLVLKNNPNPQFFSLEEFSEQQVQAEWGILLVREKREGGTNDG